MKQINEPCIWYRAGESYLLLDRSLRSLVAHLAAPLAERLRCGWPVSLVSWQSGEGRGGSGGSGGVALHGPAGQTLQCDRCAPKRASRSQTTFTGSCASTAAACFATACFAAACCTSDYAASDNILPMHVCRTSRVLIPEEWDLENLTSRFDCARDLQHVLESTGCRMNQCRPALARTCGALSNLSACAAGCW